MDIRALKQFFKKNIKTDHAKSLYVVAGDDLYLRNEAEDLIKEHFQKQEKSLDLEQFTAPQMDYEKCLDALQTLSFFSSTKLIHIKAADKANAKFLESLADFLEKGNLSGLIVVLSFSKIDKRKKVIKSLVEKSNFIETKTPYDNQVVEWVKYIASKEKLDMKNDAFPYLNFLVGPSLVEISKSVQKLKDVFGESLVGVEEVKDFISKNGEEDIFKICDLLGKGELSQAMLSLDYALKHGASSIGALSLFHRHFKIIEGIIFEQEKAAASRRGVAQKDLAAKVGVPSFFLGNYMAQAKRWTLSKTAEVFEALEAADFSLKSTGLKESTVLAGFFMEISRVLGEKPNLRSLSESLER